MDYVSDLIGWVNGDMAAADDEPVEGHTASWLEANKARLERIRARVEAKGKRFDPGIFSSY